MNFTLHFCGCHNLFYRYNVYKVLPNAWLQEIGNRICRQKVIRKRSYFKVFGSNSRNYDKKNENKLNRAYLLQIFKFLATTGLIFYNESFFVPAIQYCLFTYTVEFLKMINDCKKTKQNKTKQEKILTQASNGPQKI